MKRIEVSEALLGTRVRVVCVSLDESGAHETIELALSECRRIESAYSRFLKGNELARLNESLGEWVTVSAEFFELLMFGQQLFLDTGGLFDMTVGSILEGWGYDADYSFQARFQGGVGRVELDQGRVRLGAAVDLGGFGKGYAVDRMSEILCDFDNVLIDAGGDLKVRGLDEKGMPWRVAFENPIDFSQAIGVVEVQAPLALASSGPMRRQWKGRHHLVDPVSGKPASSMMAVYTQSEQAMVADAWATALFIAGFERAQILLQKAQVEALLVGDSGQIFRSSGFRGDLFYER